MSCTHIETKHNRAINRVSQARKIASVHIPNGAIAILRYVPNPYLTTNTNAVVLVAPMSWAHIVKNHNRTNNRVSQARKPELVLIARKSEHNFTIYTKPICNT